ncbi:telomere-binding alpha subunit central domain-containing protein [Diplodia corticola]|uniref:Protection of telomeres protein 1 n=1 Tax=Diplodia corticola TaxID=236234 RepID=A0A1J9RMI7_9PEZI|nr:telomere-binding alpha subunit central domain-containing protein [Diplodia corticola]OJD29727.1 telomere-binding alpha subunit central domain-containing protein [Diplodia corticola]
MPLGAPVRELDGFLTVEQAIARPRDAFVNVIGVVSDILPVKPSRGSDMQFAIQLQDQSVTAKLGEGRSVRVKWFLRHGEQAPKIETVGDTVILRKFKVSCYANTPLLMRHFTSECIAFRSSAMPDPHFNDSYASGQMLHYSSMPQHAKPPTPEQQVWAISLRHSLCSNSTVKTGSIVQAPSKQPIEKFNLIKNVGPGQFVDIVVEVVRMYQHAGEIYVTDYTENNLLYRYNHPNENLDIDMGRDGDAYDYTGQTRRKEWPGPFGQMTLQVKLWEPHGTFAFNRIREGEIVELKNVHIKMDSSGTKIEGALHGDRQYPDRINVISMRHRQWDPRVCALEGRKETHMQATVSREQRGPEKQQTRKEKRKEKKANLRKRNREAALTEEPVSDSDHVGLNPHVKCERPQDPTTRLTDIENNERRMYRTPNGVDCDLPFVNAMYKARVRVVDFWPDNLEDFSESLDDPGFNDVSEENPTQSSTTYTALSTGTPRWEWHFFLLVEDARQPPGSKSPVRIPLLVSHKDAECLLCLDAVDLRKDEKTLSQLRNKLFILWGDLEELKSEGKDPLDEAVAKQHSSRAFDCCVKETGTTIKPEPAMAGAKTEPSYQRIYHIHGTTIHG